MEFENASELKTKSKHDEINYKKFYDSLIGSTMSSSLSTSSSLTSPVDSGVQLLDSESEITSIMSVSGMGGDIDQIPNSEFYSENQNQNVLIDFPEKKPAILDEILTKSKSTDSNKYSFSRNSSDEVFEVEYPNFAQLNPKSADLGDVDLMHVSMSEEVNENLKVLGLKSENVSALENAITEIISKPAEEQIVFRRQRKKKSKSDTPKKRVSFHEDILNSTKIDDIHIDRGFITREPGGSLNISQRDLRKFDFGGQGRYSWAAEGDSSYSEKSAPKREIKSDIYVQNTRFSSTSSSSSSVDEDSSETDYIKNGLLSKQPKSSCLKKTKSHKSLGTNIVHEEKRTRKKTSESNLLDSNIIGSLKSILNFSTSVPLAERGVPEGQEDVTVYSTSHDPSFKRLPNSSSFTFIGLEPSPKTIPDKIEESPTFNKIGLKLTASEGFYPNYPTNQELPANIIVCDSNVYEHKGISYSYEYDKFQKSFGQSTPSPSKGSSLYRKILNEFNFFKQKSQPMKEFEAIPVETVDQDNVVEEVEEPKCKSPKMHSTFKYERSNSIVCHDDVPNSRHLSSPKRTLNNRSSVPHFKSNPSGIRQSTMDYLDAGSNTKSLSSKSVSPCDRLLRNVTLKNFLEADMSGKKGRYINLMTPVRVKEFKSGSRGQNDVEGALENEVRRGAESVNRQSNPVDTAVEFKIKRDIFGSDQEVLLKVVPVRSAYTKDGCSWPLLLVLSNTALYIVGFKSYKSYCTHFAMSYAEIGPVIVGPGAHVLLFSNRQNDRQFCVTTNCAKATYDFIGDLEIAFRRDEGKPELPGVRLLNMQDMVNLRRSICLQTSVHLDEEYFFYSIVDVQDFNVYLTESSPWGPTKEGPLMFKISERDSQWETAYFILKAGVLYMLSSSSHGVPMRVFPLINGSCQGARRLLNCRRPHTFQLTIEGTNLYLAAPDEYAASEWLQCLVHAASGVDNQRDRKLIQSCSLLVTTNHILTVRETFPSNIPSKSTGNVNQVKTATSQGSQVLSCAAIEHLVSFRLPMVEQSWCILEFSCREVHDFSGDWIFYFSTNVELENFISVLEMLWTYNNKDGDSFPLSTISEGDPLSKKCGGVYAALSTSSQCKPAQIQLI